MQQEEIEYVDSVIENTTSVQLYTNLDFTTFSASKIEAILSIATEVCSAVAIATPAIKFAVKWLLFWKPKWQVVINNALDKINALCVAFNDTTTSTSTTTTLQA